MVYKPGPQKFISDTLSRAALPLRRTQTNRPDHLMIFQVHQKERFRQEVEETNLEEATLVTDNVWSNFAGKLAGRPLCTRVMALQG